MAVINVSVLPTGNLFGVEIRNRGTLKELELLLNLSYYTFLSPFRVFSSGGTVSLDASKIRKVTCFLLHSSFAVFQIIVHFYLRVKADFVRRHPQLIFNALYRITALGFTLSTIHTVWCRSRVLEKSRRDSAIRNGKRVCHPWWFKLLLLVAIVGGFVTRVVYVMIKSPGKKFRSTLDELGCIGNSNQTAQVGNVWMDLFMETTCLPGKIAVVAYAFLRVGVYLVEALGESLLLVVAVAIHRIAFDKTDSTSAEVRQGYALMQEYKESKGIIGLLGKATSIPLLFMTVQLVMYCSLLLPGSIQIADPMSSLTAALFMATNASTFLLAAEANRKMKEKQRLIISAFPIEESANVATSLATLPGEDGLSGGDFFIVSYPFIGSMMTAVFTYVLVVQQLKVPG